MGVLDVLLQQYCVLSLPLTIVGFSVQGLDPLNGGVVPAVPGAGPNGHCVPVGGTTHVTLDCTVPAQPDALLQVKERPFALVLKRYGNDSS